MNRFFRWYYKNKIRFWIMIFIIIGSYLLLLLLNNVSKNAIQTKNKNYDNTVTINFTNKGTVKSTESMLGLGVPKENLETANTIIDEFIKHCNNGEIEEAYNLLSDECKEVMFENIESFKKYYISMVFNEKKTYNMQNLSGKTYKVEYKDNPMASGKNSTEEYIRDYITIVTKNNETKLNVNNYIGRTNIDRTNEIDDVSVKVLSKDTYMNYEVYNLEITNNSKNDVALDNFKNSTGIYIEDKNNNKYYSYINELTTDLLTIRAKQTKNISIRFTNSYVTDMNITNITFNNYMSNINNTNAEKITISL